MEPVHKIADGLHQVGRKLTQDSWASVKHNYRGVCGYRRHRAACDQVTDEYHDFSGSLKWNVTGCRCMLPGTVQIFVWRERGT
jgi:hypothetical protein